MTDSLLEGQTLMLHYATSRCFQSIATGDKYHNRLTRENSFQQVTAFKVHHHLGKPGQHYIS